MTGGQLNFKGDKDAGTATQNLGSFGERFFSKKGVKRWELYTFWPISHAKYKFGHIT